MTVSEWFLEEWNSRPFLAAYWIPKLLDDVKDNTENIDVNRGNIADNAENLQD